MQDLTHGSVRGHLWKMTAFMLVGMFMQMLYSLIDLYWVGRLGKHAVAAVSVAGNLQMIVVALTQVLGVGAAAVVSHAVGRKDHANAQALFNQAVGLSLAMAIAFLAAGLALHGAYSDAVSGDAQTALLSRQFLLWFIPGLAFQFPLAALGSSLRGTGNMRPGLIAQMATIVINVALAPVLIFGWGTGIALGISGAAIATLVAILAGTVGLALYLRREARYLRVHASAMRPDVAAWRRMLGIGLPAGAEFGLMTLYLVFVYVLIRPFGAEAQAGFGIGMRIMQSGFMPAMAVSFACAAVAGQNYGARRFDRVRETFTAGALIATAMMAAFTLICHVAPAHMTRFFSPDPAVIEVGDNYLRIISWNFVAFGIIVVSAGMFQGLGNTWPSLISSAVRIGLIVFPAWWLSTTASFRITQIWWLSTASVGVQMVLCLLFLRREFARKLEVAMPSAAAVEPAT
jgi:putative MATE family efflux protein